MDLSQRNKEKVFVKWCFFYVHCMLFFTRFDSNNFLFNFAPESIIIVVGMNKLKKHFVLYYPIVLLYMETTTHISIGG